MKPILFDPNRPINNIPSSLDEFIDIIFYKSFIGEHNYWYSSKEDEYEFVWRTRGTGTQWEVRCSRLSPRWTFSFGSFVGIGETIEIASRKYLMDRGHSFEEAEYIISQVGQPTIEDDDPDGESDWDEDGTDQELAVGWYL